MIGASRMGCVACDADAVLVEDWDWMISCIKYRPLYGMLD